MYAPVVFNEVIAYFNHEKAGENWYITLGYMTRAIHRNVAI